MTAEEFLVHAAALVARRRRVCGAPVGLFERVAVRWSQVLGTKVTPAQVIVCLVDLNPSRGLPLVPHACAGSRSMSARIKPHKVRGRQLEEIRELDPDGRIVGPSPDCGHPS